MCFSFISIWYDQASIYTVWYCSVLNVFCRFFNTHNTCFTFVCIAYSFTIIIVHYNTTVLLLLWWRNFPVCLTNKGNSDSDSLTCTTVPSALLLEESKEQLCTKLMILYSHIAETWTTEKNMFSHIFFTGHMVYFYKYYKWDLQNLHCHFVPSLIQQDLPALRACSFLHGGWSQSCS